MTHGAGTGGSQTLECVSFIATGHCFIPLRISDVATRLTGDAWCWCRGRSGAGMGSACPSVYFRRRYKADRRRVVLVQGVVRHPDGCSSYPRRQLFPPSVYFRRRYKADRRRVVLVQGAVRRWAGGSSYPKWPLFHPSVYFRRRYKADWWRVVLVQGEARRWDGSFYLLWATVSSLCVFQTALQG